MQDPLSGLKDIHLPDPVGWWPPAPGWWLLAALLLVLLFLLGRVWRARRCGRALYDEALAELEVIRSHYESRGDPQQAVRDLSRLLRRVAISRFPREEVAGLVGDDWLGFLDRAIDGGGFLHGPGRVLAEGPYRAEPETFDVEPLFTLVRRWLEKVTREVGHA
ncbi:MAG TPA: DUF4381 domain-containing protein [Chromatiaceae bacterium]|nr:DUF4381 domain-containing protein [Chromatiaceae bacterium]